MRWSQKVVKSLEGMGNTKVVPLRGNGGGWPSKRVLGMDFPTTCLGKGADQPSFCLTPDPIGWLSLSVPIYSTNLSTKGISWGHHSLCLLSGRTLFWFSALHICHVSAFLVPIGKLLHILQWWGTHPEKCVDKWHHYCVNNIDCTGLCKPRVTRLAMQGSPSYHQKTQWAENIQGYVTHYPGESMKHHFNKQKACLLK